MLQIEFTEEEQHTLRDVLESDLADLRMEISETDRRAFKEQLKQKEQILTGIVDKLR